MSGPLVATLLQFVTSLGWWAYFRLIWSASNWLDDRKYGRMAGYLFASLLLGVILRPLSRLAWGLN